MDPQLQRIENKTRNSYFDWIPYIRALSKGSLVARYYGYLRQLCYQFQAHLGDIAQEYARRSMPTSIAFPMQGWGREPRSGVVETDRQKPFVKAFDICKT